MPSERDNAADARVCAARTRLADRMNALERRLTSTVDWASDAVRDTAGSIRGAVVGITGEVKEMVRHASDQFHEIVDVARTRSRAPLAERGRRDNRRIYGSDANRAPPRSTTGRSIFFAGLDRIAVDRPVGAIIAISQARVSRSR